MDTQQTVSEMVVAIQRRLLELETGIRESVETLFESDMIGLIYSRAGLTATAFNQNERISEQMILELWRQRRSLIAQQAALEKFLAEGGDPELNAQIQALQERCEALLKGGEP